MVDSLWFFVAIYQPLTKNYKLSKTNTPYSERSSRSTAAVLSRAGARASGTRCRCHGTSLGRGRGQLATGGDDQGLALDHHVGAGTGVGLCLREAVGVPLGQHARVARAERLDRHVVLHGDDAERVVGHNLVQRLAGGEGHRIDRRNGHHRGLCHDRRRGGVAREGAVARGREAEGERQHEATAPEERGHDVALGPVGHTREAGGEGLACDEVGDLVGERVGATAEGRQRVAAGGSGGNGNDRGQENSGVEHVKVCAHIIARISQKCKYLLAGCGESGTLYIYEHHPRNARRNGHAR